MKQKRKYTRKVLPEHVQSKSDSLKYSDIPLREEIEHIIEYRKALGLSDDSVERKKRALRYQEFRRK